MVNTIMGKIVEIVKVDNCGQESKTIADALFNGNKKEAVKFLDMLTADGIIQRRKLSRQVGTPYYYRLTEKGKMIASL